MQDHHGLEIPENFEEILDMLRKVNIKASEKQIQNRRKFLESIKKFHEEAGTLTDKVKENLRIIENENDYIFIMCAHQPNFLPYAGVVRKTVLMQALKQKLEKIYSKPVVLYYQFSDQTLPDRWVKTAQIPDVSTKSGFLNIVNNELPVNSSNRITGYGKYSIRINSIKKPSSKTLSFWKNQIRSWIRNSLKSTKRLAKEIGYDDVLVTISQNEKSLMQNAKEFIDVLDESYERAKNFADMNEFMLSNIVNKIWGYDILFARDSESSHFLKEETFSLLQRYQEYFQALREAKLKIRKMIITRKLMPFWYHCECGGKVNLFTEDEEDLKTFKGNCLNCKRYYEFNVSELSLESDEFFSKISLRSIPFLPLISNGLMPNIYVGGTGGLEDYYPEMKMVADSMKINLPVIVVWNPLDTYAGLGQIRAFLLSKKQNSKQVNEKISKIFSGKYSILDYAMNIGLNETSRQWLQNIQERDLDGDVKMQSIFDERFVEEYLNFVDDLNGKLKKKSNLIRTEKIIKVEKAATRFFGRLLKEHKEDYKIVGYGSKKAQTIRFKALTDVDDLNNKSVLDVGCGLGHLVDFFNENNIHVEYTGYDIMEKFIDTARKSYPDKKFEVRNIMKDLPKEKFDYVLANGVLNILVENNEEFIKELIRRMFKICKRGIAISMLSLKADYFDPECYYYSPEKLLNWVSKEISRWVVLKHDYLPHDFTLYVYKKPLGERW